MRFNILQCLEWYNPVPPVVPQSIVCPGILLICELGKSLHCVSCEEDGVEEDSENDRVVGPTLWGKG